MCNQCDTQEYMYASRGPVSTMRGDETAAPQGMVCENHDDRPAVKRIQGETDSFGCEYYGLCQECYDNEQQRAPEKISGTCDWCKNHSDNLKETRDFEEGLAGPVYDVCTGCRQRQNDRAAEELEAMDTYRDNSEVYGDDYPDDGHDDEPLDEASPQQ